MFPDRYASASDLDWTSGRNNIAIGFNWDYLQLSIHCAAMLEKSSRRCLAMSHKTDGEFMDLGI